MSQVCMISGKKPQVANSVSHSNRKTKRRQAPNLQWKRFWLPEENRWIRLRVCTSVMKTLNKHGLLATLKRYGADPAILRR